ncbi:MAG: hypothetical protein H7837_02025 [Magnetococcus sp. MYC-9]
MIPNTRRKERLLALAVVGLLALNFPLLSLFNRSSLVFGVPALFLYLFLFWLAFVVLIALIMRAQPAERD